MPGVRGPAQTPTTPLDAKLPFMASFSNQSSSRSPTDMVMSRIVSARSRRRSPSVFPAVASVRSTSPGGGCIRSSGRSTSATRPSIRSHSGQRAASAFETAAISARVRSGSPSQKTIGCPSAVTVPQLGSHTRTRRPCSARRSSRITFGWSRLSTYDARETR